MILDERTRTRLHGFCHQYGVARLSLFGSRQAGSHRPDSDLDLLVEFVAGRTPGLFALAAMQEALEDLFGLTVDLRTPRDLPPDFRSSVQVSAEVLYAA